MAIDKMISAIKTDNFELDINVPNLQIKKIHIQSFISYVKS